MLSFSVVQRARARTMNSYGAKRENGENWWANFERLTQKWLEEILREIARLQELPYDEKCGARTRAGTPCKRWPVRRTGRCPNHGGMSTGPKTKAGQARIARAQRRRWIRWRAEQAEGRHEA